MVMIYLTTLSFSRAESGGALEVDVFPCWLTGSLVRAVADCDCGEALDAASRQQAALPPPHPHLHLPLPFTTSLFIACKLNTQPV